MDVIPLKEESDDDGHKRTFTNYILYIYICIVLFYESVAYNNIICIIIMMIIIIYHTHTLYYIYMMYTYLCNM